MTHDPWMATNGRTLTKNSVVCWKTSDFRNNFGLANNDRGCTQQKMAGAWLKLGVPPHADLGPMGFLGLEQRWEINFETKTATRYGKDNATLPDCVEENPVGRLDKSAEGDSKEHEHYDRQGQGAACSGHCTIRNWWMPQGSQLLKTYPLEWRTSTLDWFSWDNLPEATFFLMGRSLGSLLIFPRKPREYNSLMVDIRDMEHQSCYAWISNSYS